jgi:hypothetical protein
MTKDDLSLEFKDGSTSVNQSISLKQHINQNEGRNHIIISMGAEISFTKFRAAS